MSRENSSLKVSTKPTFPSKTYLMATHSFQPVMKTFDTLSGWRRAVFHWFWKLWPERTWSCRFRPVGASYPRPRPFSRSEKMIFFVECCATDTETTPL